MGERLFRLFLCTALVLLLVSCQGSLVGPMNEPEPGSLKLQISVDEESSYAGDVAFVIELSNGGGDPVKLDMSSGGTILDLAVSDAAGTEVWRRSTVGWPVFAQQVSQGREIVLGPRERVVWKAQWQRFEQRDLSGRWLDAGTYDVHAEIVRPQAGAGGSVVVARSNDVALRLVHE